MPVHVSYPGVYVEELPSSEKSVTGISTSTTAFVDFFARGPMSDANQAGPVQIFNYRDFQRTFVLIFFRHNLPHTHRAINLSAHHCGPHEPPPSHWAGHTAISYTLAQENARNRPPQPTIYGPTAA